MNELSAYRDKLEIGMLKVLSTFGSMPEGFIHVETTFNGRAVVIQVADCEQIHVARTNCERDILDLLRCSDKPLMARDVHAALEAAGKLWGKSTIAQTLSNLSYAQIVVNYRGKGYQIRSAPVKTAK